MPLVLIAGYDAFFHGLLAGIGFAAIASFYVYATVILVGVPAFWLLQDHLAPTLMASTIVGMVVASLIWIFAALLDRGFAVALLFTAPLGAVGGMSFWAIALRGIRQRSEG